ncbi:MAG TPA: phosphoribosylamine--glycine ligase [Candidatus Nitrosotenuis sp.]|nr:phosphoribosylamine--glycine ligase [Candidatus Nitrosotenuis sp.]
MKILLLGSGGREHALAWKLRQSPQVEKIWCAPGNGGIALDAECVPADLKDVAALASLAERLKPDLTLVGPELPLVLGVVDEFERRGLAILGPAKSAAQLEGSKVFAKEFMERHGIPTAALYGIHDSAGAAYSALCAVDWPMVIKADGLCAGKGVLVAQSPDEATAFIERLMDKCEFGDAGARVVLEEALEGQELSYIVLTDGETILPLVPTQDHKRLLDGDKGPNTGGMGAYSMDGMLSPKLEATIRSTIVQPVIHGMAAEGRPYKGFLYFGLMLTQDGPKVLEFNCRLGDPETQAMVMRMDFDLAAACQAATKGTLKSAPWNWKPGASACVVMSSGGYPGEYRTGLPIHGLEKSSNVTDAYVFHSGTKQEGHGFVTSGGRVLGVSAYGGDLQQALKSCYDICSDIRFERAHFRTDIGSRPVQLAQGASS